MVTYIGGEKYEIELGDTKCIVTSQDIEEFLFDLKSIAELDENISFNIIDDEDMKDTLESEYNLGYEDAKKTL